MSKDTMLFENKWFSVVERELDNGIKWTFGTHPWCNAGGVAILPFKQEVYNERGIGYTELSFLGRVEICPAHSDEPALCVVAGGMDKDGETPIQVAVRELAEETGFIARTKDMISLGAVRPSKGTDTTMHLFAVDVTNLERAEASGDGSLIEQLASTKWIRKREAVFSKDPLLVTCVARLEVFNEKR
jgi:ADP-ribose pyrophosphatase YjhB (NUDIX family)